MAKKPAKETDKDDAADGGEADGGAKKKKLFIMIGAGVAALVVIGGAGAFFMGAFSSKPPQHEAEHAEPAKAAMYVDLPDMTVNLSSVDQRATYLKVKVALEVSDKATVDKITPVLPRVLDAFQIYLRELRVSDLDGSAGLYRVKEELQRRINIAIAPARVEAVLFKEILVQ